MAVRELGQGRLLLDLDFQDVDGIIGSYLLPKEDGWALVEVGPTTCRAHLLTALGRAGVEPHEVKDVLMTHVHLDHAGAAGSLVQALPQATFYIHEAGAPHLLDPSKLQASARRAWGPASDVLWGDILPVPPARLRSLRGGESLPLAHGASLKVIATPGHARHHLAFFDTATAGVFTGDGAGVLLPGARHVRPAVPPPDLDIPELLRSLEIMASLQPRWLYFSHFGPADHAEERLREAGTNVRRWETVALEVARKGGSVEAISEALSQEEQARSRAEGESEGFAQKANRISGLELAAQGLLRYFVRTGQVPAPS
jgi:glyoxylase-like metal-dependent hydrolase (beta-lactamase superfamily II)